jgi:hypothetical protein
MTTRPAAPAPFAEQRCDNQEGAGAAAKCPFNFSVAALHKTLSRH